MRVAEAFVQRTDPAVPEGHPMRGESRTRLAWALSGQGQAKRALALYDEAVALLEQQGVLDQLGGTLAERGGLLRRERRYEEALIDLRRAEELLRPTGGVYFAETCFDLAKTLDALGRSPRESRALAARAADFYDQAGRDDIEAEVREWIRAVGMAP